MPTTTSKPDTWGYNLYTEGGIGFDFTVNNGDLVSILSTDLVSDGEWHFVVITRSSDYLEIWVDGNLMAERSWSGVGALTSSDIMNGQSGSLGSTSKG